MWSQILIASSMVTAGLFDVKERSVHDIVWIPAAFGIFYELITRTDLIFQLAVKMLIIGVIGIFFTIYGALGQADAIALFVLSSDPYYVSPLLAFIASALIALGHISYIHFSNKGGIKVIPMEQFKKEECWIPRAIIVNGERIDVSRDVNKARDEVLSKQPSDAKVEVTYGVPTVAYLALGYVFFLIYLVLFNYGSFLSLP